MIKLLLEENRISRWIPSCTHIIIIITNIYIAPLLPKSPQRSTNQHNTQNIYTSHTNKHTYTRFNNMHHAMYNTQQKTHLQITQEASGKVTDFYGSVTPQNPQPKQGFPVNQGVITIRENGGTYSVTTSSLTMAKWQQSHMPSVELHPARQHVPSYSHIQ